MDVKYFAFIVLACSLAVSSCIAGPSDDQGFEGIIGFGGKVYDIEDQLGGGALREGSPYESSLIPLKDGRLLLVCGMWRAPGGRILGAHTCWGAISADQGKTWSEPQPLKTKDGEFVKGRTNSLFRLKSGAIGLINWNVFYRSEDEGKTWTGPIPIAVGKRKGRVRNDCALVLKSGRIIAPASVSGIDPGSRKYARKDDILEGMDFGYGICYYSDDQGQTWQESDNFVYVPLERGLKGMYGWSEWTVVELKNGRLLGIGRNSLGRFFQSISEDQGETWLVPKPTQLACLPSPCALKRIPSTGDLLIIWNQASEEEGRLMLIRHRLSCAISKDDGKTWQNFKNLESLDDVAKIEPPPIKAYSEHERIFETYNQPEDRKRYHRAPGPLRVSYPTLCFLNDKVVITYGYGCHQDTVGYVACKIRVLPTEWFYK